VASLLNAHVGLLSWNAVEFPRLHRIQALTPQCLGTRCGTSNVREGKGGYTIFAVFEVKKEISDQWKR
jgi:hypothetical protein